VETVITQGDLLSVPIGIDFLDAGHAVVSSLLASRIVKVALADGAQSTIARGPMALTNPGHCGGCNQHLRRRQGQQTAAADFGDQHHHRAGHGEPDVWHRH